MAGPGAVAAVGRSVVALLNRRFTEDFPPPQRRPSAVLIGTSDFDQANAAGANIQFPAVTVYCYRVTVDAETRASASARTAIDGIPRIPLCIHFLVTAWDDSADFELQWLGKAIQILERDASLGGSMLHAVGQFAPDETVNLVADDIDLRTMSEAFTALTTDFRLSMPYLARVVRIECPPEPTPEPVSTVGAGFDRPDGRS